MRLHSHLAFTITAYNFKELEEKRRKSEREEGEQETHTVTNTRLSILIATFTESATPSSESYCGFLLRVPLKTIPKNPSPIWSSITTLRRDTSHLSTLRTFRVVCRSMPESAEFAKSAGSCAVTR